MTAGLVVDLLQAFPSGRHQLSISCYHKREKSIWSPLKVVYFAHCFLRRQHSWLFPGNESGSCLSFIPANAWNVPYVFPCFTDFPQGVLTLWNALFQTCVLGQLQLWRPWLASKSLSELSRPPAERIQCTSLFHDPSPHLCRSTWHTLLPWWRCTSPLADWELLRSGDHTCSVFASPALDPHLANVKSPLDVNWINEWVSK